MPPDMLRVLTLATLFPDSSRPNFGIFVERQVQALLRRGDAEVRVVAPVGVPPWPLCKIGHYAALSALPLRETRNGIAVERPRFTVLPKIGVASRPRALARAILPLLKRIRSAFAFDVIDAEFFFPDGPAAVWLGRQLGVPVSIKARGSDLHFWGVEAKTAALVRDAGCAADGMLAVSAALRDDMIALGMSGDRIRVHRTGVDLTRFRPADRAALKASFGISGPMLLTVGALIPRKGQSLVIQALADVPDATLVFAGAGPDAGSLAALAARLGVEKRVRFLGAVPHDALPRLFAAADAMVLASASEGLANAWVEAIACGTPVVITDVGGARELVTRASAGRLVAREAGAIAEGIRAVLAERSPAAEIRACAEPFTWEANAEGLHAHLSALVAARRG
jgi:glycosyltransferase involved in cell wall biosynthesis